MRGQGMASGPPCWRHTATIVQGRENVMNTATIAPTHAVGTTPKSSTCGTAHVTASFTPVRTEADLILSLPASGGGNQPPAMTLNFPTPTVCRWAMMLDDGHLRVGWAVCLHGEIQGSSASL